MSLPWTKGLKLKCPQGPGVKVQVGLMTVATRGEDCACLGSSHPLALVALCHVEWELRLPNLPDFHEKPEINICMHLLLKSL